MQSVSLRETGFRASYAVTMIRITQRAMRNNNKLKCGLGVA